ncbi:SufE family protein [Candidatus Aquiluna sp. UB-MaderosW2red]|jgi:cysteine desulfuration protein SufE|uniref:SufE family protein n=1 Tax=Candidatus Aquiluna sp. UB-MaderosW2red TaxID=1855377 RepID=UPI000875EB6A|nr:SufE family protein [Candidatus Aquiluna sp. UB-MaderosW2red]SCX11275.1 cysteine desulfuration protein SufE [Candidatus Aquiluna sp. UB-MaderosW2red]
MIESARLVTEDFNLTPERERLQLLLEFSEALPELADRFGQHPELMERVEECQSPVFIAVDGDSSKVNLHFSAPRESPTTRGFASVLSSALNGQSAADILALSDDFPSELGLDKLISPLRVRGMRGMLYRIKRKTRELIQLDN